MLLVALITPLQDSGRPGIGIGASLDTLPGGSRPCRVKIVQSREYFQPAAGLGIEALDREPKVLKPMLSHRHLALNGCEKCPPADANVRHTALDRKGAGPLRARRL
jgi:hypothetical protein